MNKIRIAAKRDVLVVLGFVAIALAAHYRYIAATQPDVPYMDTMRMLVFQEAWREGKLSLFDLWEPASAHHGFINPALLFLNVQWFGLDARLATQVTGWVMAFLSLVLAVPLVAEGRRVARDARWQARLPYVATAAMVVILLFSWAGFQLLTLELGLALWVKNSFFAAFFIAHQWWLRKPFPDAVRAGVLSTAGAAIVLCAGGGWSYGFVVAVVATQALLQWSNGRRERGRSLLLRWLPAIALVGAVVVYTALGSNPGDPTARAPLAPASALLPLYALGSTWIGSEAFLNRGGDTDWFLVVGTITIFMGAWALYRRWRAGVGSGSLLPIHLMGYAASCALLFSAARGGWGADAVAAPRYFMDLVLFPVGTLWLLVEDAQAKRDRASSVSLATWCVLAAALVAGHAWTYRAEWATAPFRALAFERMEEALRRGVATTEDARVVQAPRAYAQQAADIMRARRLSIFKDDLAECSEQGIRHVEGWHAAERRQRWMQQRAVLDLPPCGCEAAMTAYLPATFSARELVVDTGTRQSYALQPGTFTSIALPASALRRVVVLEVSEVTIPERDLPGSRDKRVLGILFSSLSFACGKAPP